MRFFRIGLLLIPLLTFFIFGLVTNSSYVGYILGATLALIIDPIMIVGVSILSILVTLVSNRIYQNKFLVREIITIFLFLIGSAFIAIMINIIFINPFLETIGRGPSPNGIRIFVVFIYSYLINSIYFIFKYKSA